MIIGRDFGDSSNTDIPATFDNAPHPDWYQLSVDPDLVTLNNGDVLYLGHARSRAPLITNPAWFDVAYRNNFGPGRDCPDPCRSRRTDRRNGLAFNRLWSNVSICQHNGPGYHGRRIMRISADA